MLSMDTLNTARALHQIHHPQNISIARVHFADLGLQNVLLVEGQKVLLGQ